jgi:hypothetical protein|uniref:phospholipid carrier-dependent glycosyltransferase n=1 Tax=Candidatus Limnocylindrus sp. TaxID=2802978 RepID=UPI00404A020F
MTRVERAARLGAVGLLTALALLLHGQAARLPVDFDEDDYMRAGQIFADEIRTGNPGILLENNYRIEHPQFVKILIATVMLSMEPIQRIPELPVTANPYELMHRPTLAAVRRMESAFGVLAVTTLALVSPVAALLLATSTWVIKYTSQVMLEAVPLLFSLLGVALYELARSASNARRRRLAYLASAIGIGLAVGAKYPYAIAGLAIVVDRLRRTRRGEPIRIKDAIGWSAIAALAFFAVNPYLWSDPIGRLIASAAYHPEYATSEQVQSTGFPAWQQLIWLMQSVPWHDAQNIFAVKFDAWMLPLALVGLIPLARNRPVYAIWLGLGAVALLFWPTKWPQYLLTIAVPYALAGAAGVALIAKGAALLARRALKGR